MTSFFSLNSSVRPSTSSSAPRDTDPFSPMNRPMSNASSSVRRSELRRIHEGQTRNGFGTNGDAAVPIPPSTSSHFGNGGERNPGSLGGLPPFDVARSPPNQSNKNTKHVPCKFFRQGLCQAGNACPFSHNPDPLNTQAPCKYFMKGNCKFGAKCALAHYLPDGRRVNRSDLDYGMGHNGRQLNIGGRLDPPMYQNQDSVLANSLLGQQQFQPPELYLGSYPFGDQEDTDAYHDRFNQYQNYNMPALDPGLNSPPGSHFGSPPDDSQLPRSPVERFTALNAPLPRSFDANGMSHIAKYGPLGESVPDKFGMKSPSGSLPKKSLAPPDALPATHQGSKFASPLGLSPQTQEDTVGSRVMHSNRISKPRVVSASVPRSGLMDDWDPRFNYDADLLPNSLHDEVLTPQEKVRRMSRPEQEFIAAREPANGLAIPSGTSSKVGSPSAAGSPSRFRALWEEQREKKGADANSNTASANIFGHVGSPLRESWMPTNTNSSPGNTSLHSSGISQQMARLGLNRTESSDSNSSRPQQSGLRHSSAPTVRYERAISSPKISTTRRIDEDGEGVFFPMDDENSKRSSVNWGGKSPNLGPIGDPLDRAPSKENAKVGAFTQTNGAKGMFGFRPEIGSTSSQRM